MVTSILRGNLSKRMVVQSLRRKGRTDAQIAAAIGMKRQDIQAIPHQP